MIRTIAAAAALTALALPALADNPPLMRPNRDVAITYRVMGDEPGKPGISRERIVHVSAAAKGDLLRVDLGGTRETTMIVDRATQRATMLMPARQNFLEMPYGGANITPFNFEDARFTRRGHATVAGRSCTEYDVTSEDGNGTLCLTDDGIMLRGKGVSAQGRGGEVQATEVTYAPQPAALFQPPPGYKRIELPSRAMPPNAPDDTKRPTGPRN